jgi:hypothetical protein
MVGLQGNDTITLARADDTANAGLGNDRITLAGISTTLNTVVSGAGNDVILVNTAANSIGGSLGLNEGNDAFNNSSVSVISASIGGNAGADTITLLANVTNSLVGGGKNADNLNFSAGTFTTSTVNGGAGADTVAMNAGTFNITTVQSGDGHDRIAASAAVFGTSIVTMGKGLDSIALGAQSTVTVAGGSGADTINLVGAFAGGGIFGDGLGQKVSSSGGGGNDVIGSTGSTFGEVAAISIFGASGSDTIRFNSGSTGFAFIVDGGFGADLMGGSAAAFGFSASTLNGGDGNDTIVLNEMATQGGSLVLGGAGNDSIALFTQAVVSGSINGGGGADTINLASGLLGGSFTQTTSVNGGSGADVIIFNVDGGGIQTLTSLTAGNVTGQTAYHGAVTHQSGDVIQYNNTAISTTGAAWAGAGGQILIVSSITALTISAAANGANYSAQSAGSISVFSDGTDTYFFLNSQNVTQTFNFVVDGADLTITTAVGLVNAGAANFGFTVDAVSGTAGNAAASGVEITLT